MTFEQDIDSLNIRKWLHVWKVNTLQTFYSVNIKYHVN